MRGSVISEMTKIEKVPVFSVILAILVLMGDRKQRHAKEVRQMAYHGKKTGVFDERVAE